MICFQISIFEPLETTISISIQIPSGLWFAFKLVSLNHWKQLLHNINKSDHVVICFQISIFEPLETTNATISCIKSQLWFAFKLVSLNHWKQLNIRNNNTGCVVICFQISIFEPLETTVPFGYITGQLLWFAFKLVSLNHWKQLRCYMLGQAIVVICFQISIFEPLETTIASDNLVQEALWFAFKLVSLNHWKQLSQIFKADQACCDLLSN